MLEVLSDKHYTEYYSNGFVETGISLKGDLVDEIKQHYLTKHPGHNDFLKFFANNEHQAYLEGRAIGIFFNAFPKTARKMVKKFYDRAYSKAVYCEQAYIGKVLEQLLENGFQRLFKTRYIVASYDMYLRNGHQSPAAGIHSDLPNFHHVYETENDLSLYIPLVDLDEDNGGRLSVLPEGKLRIPGNVLLKLLYEHFSKDPSCLDEDGYVDSDRITPEQLAAFVKSKAHQDLMAVYKGATSLAKGSYANDFKRAVETKGTVLMFNNKNFHAAERWKNESYDREIYVIRMVPIYDARIKLKSMLHGVPVNNILIDLEQGTIHRSERPVDLATIPAAHKLQL
jgi:hypothetical protein